jgi:hypothetical protein
MNDISSRFNRSQLKVFLKIEVVCVLALCIAAVVAAVLVYVQTTIIGEKDLFSPIQTAEIMVMSVLYFGIIPTVLLGAPIYALLKASGRDNWAIVLFVGLVAGFVMLFINFRLGIYSIVCGGIIASITHACFRNKKI